MSINKVFNQFISENFKGLSVGTLCQFLKLYSGLSFLNDTYIDNMVCVELYHVFIGRATSDEQHTFDSIKDIVDSCDWL